MTKIKGGRVKTIKALKSSLKRGGGQGFLTRVPADGTMTVRFIEEPTEWIEFYEFYDEKTKNYYPLSDDGPQPDPRGDSKPSKRYLANAVDVDNNRVVALAMPTSLAQTILKKYEKFETLLDRDYELSRDGSGLDTVYDATPESPTKMNLKKFTPLDLLAELERQLPSGDDDDDDDDDDYDDDYDEDDEPVARRVRKRARKVEPPKKSSKSKKDKPKGLKKSKR